MNVKARSSSNGGQQEDKCTHNSTTKVSFGTENHMFGSAHKSNHDGIVRSFVEHSIVVQHYLFSLMQRTISLQRTQMASCPQGILCSEFLLQLLKVNQSKPTCICETPVVHLWIQRLPIIEVHIQPTKSQRHVMPCLDILVPSCLE